VRESDDTGVAGWHSRHLSIQRDAPPRDRVPRPRATFRAFPRMPQIGDEGTYLEQQLAGETAVAV